MAINNFLIKISTILFLIIASLLLLSTSQKSQVSSSSSIENISTVSSNTNTSDHQYADKDENRNDNEDGEDDEDEEFYVLDKVAGQTPATNVGIRSSSRFLASYIIKKGTHCDPKTYNICNGVPANKGKSILYCCKRHCRNVLGDRNNCGRCGHKCKFEDRCCNGKCTKVLFNKHNCGKCGKKCKAGVACDNGYCGYA
ncbi:hypothetical protein CsatB_008985 [Cannabis sativa]